MVKQWNSMWEVRNFDACPKFQEQLSCMNCLLSECYTINTKKFCPKSSNMICQHRQWWQLGLENDIKSVHLHRYTWEIQSHLNISPIFTCPRLQIAPDPFGAIELEAPLCIPVDIWKQLWIINQIQHPILKWPVINFVCLFSLLIRDQKILLLSLELVQQCMNRSISECKWNRALTHLLDASFQYWESSFSF